MVGFPKWQTIITDLTAKFSHLQAATARHGGGGAHRPAVDLVRCITRSNGARDQRPLTGWFGHNFGVPYKTRMEAPTALLIEAPLPIPYILRDLGNDVRLALSMCNPGSNSVVPSFNEALIVGNYPGQKMNWHSDGEDSVVGDVVASISFGSFGAHVFFGLNQKTLHREIAPRQPGCAGDRSHLCWQRHGSRRRGP